MRWGWIPARCRVLTVNTLTTLQNVTKAWGEVVVSKDINLDIHEGEFVVFVGPSGCGKSTLLRMIAGLETITSGDLFIGEKRMNDTPPAERGVGMVFQSYALYPHLSVAENMSFGLKLAGAKKEVINQRVNQVAEVLQLAHLLDRKPKALSGGQRQRVAIGRTLVAEPSVFLLDEPLSNLDAALRVQMRIEISRLHKRLGRTMIYVIFWMPNRHKDKPLGERLRLALQELGPVWIKFGQMLSTRRDLFPPHIADQLALLQDKVAPFLGLGLMFGTAGLPHILMRFFTVSDAREARKSVFYATGFMGYFYILTFIIAERRTSTNSRLMTPGPALTSISRTSILKYFEWLTVDCIGCTVLSDIFPTPEDNHSARTPKAFAISTILVVWLAFPVSILNIATHRHVGRGAENYSTWR